MDWMLGQGRTRKGWFGPSGRGSGVIDGRRQTSIVWQFRHRLRIREGGFLCIQCI
jgi:hypothetical protein